MSLNAVNEQEYSSDSIRMNPRSLNEKITNWHELSDSIKMLRINAEEIFQNEFSKSLKIPLDKISLVPDREPNFFHPSKITYQVSQPHVSEKSIAYVHEALYTKHISSASKWIRLLSLRLQTLFQVPVALPCSNGFTALLLALQASGIQEGDEVICPSFTMIAVANAIHFVNATPVFVDLAANGSYNPNWNEISKRITTKTKACIICHTYGVPIEYADLKVIVKECKKRNILLIEDISECVGIVIMNQRGETRLLGTFGDYACASMYANKIVNAGDGGFILCKNVGAQAKLEMFLNHGFSKVNNLVISFNFFYNYSEVINGILEFYFSEYTKTLGIS